MHKDAAKNLRGMASSLRDISGQLNRVKKIYTQYLTIAAKSNFFVPVSSTVEPVVETWMPRFWVDRLAAHVLATLLIAAAVTMAILQYVHRKDRRRLYLAGPPGSIASDVSMTSSARFGLLLNAGDNEKDLERKLHGMRFGIEHSTGQIIVEREDGSDLARFVEEERRRAMGDVVYSEDVQASLLSNEKGPGSGHHDSFVGLRNREPESHINGGWRRSAVGSTTPLVSPSPSATFSQAQRQSAVGSMAPLISPSPSATFSQAQRQSAVGSMAPLISPPPSATFWQTPRQSATGSTASLVSPPPSAGFSQAPRQSATGSTAPLVSPLPSATFSQTRLLSSSSAVVLSPAPIETPVAINPPPSSTVPILPVTRFPAPPGPPPQLHDSTLYHDPFASKPA
jgi:hypothetical protein